VQGVGDVGEAAQSPDAAASSAPAPAPPLAPPPALRNDALVDQRRGRSGGRAPCASASGQGKPPTVRSASRVCSSAGSDAA
jgi:hypothetical protein